MARGDTIAAPVRLSQRSAAITATSRSSRVEEADHEGRAARCRCIELPAGEAEPTVGGGHVRKRTLRQAKPAARRDLDLARGHPQEARFDGSDRSARLDQAVDIGFAEIERHEPQV
jgi:hypothetical protein